MNLTRYQKENPSTADSVEYALWSEAQEYLNSRNENTAVLSEKRPHRPCARTELLDSGNYLILIAPPKSESAKLGLFGIFIDSDRSCCILCEKDSYFDSLKENIDKSESSTGVLCRLIEWLIWDDHTVLESLEQKVTALEERLINDRPTNKATAEIIKWRRQLLQYKQYYEQLIDVLDGFVIVGKTRREDAEHTYYINLKSRLTRLSGRITDLRESVAQAREAYQAQVEIGQNRLMKLFTIITAIFMPLQLITGWYGMNLIMPETDLAITYPIVVAVCVLIVVLCFFLFKRNKWF